ncbi:hypothetical protein Tcan_09487, partial [Toxocara canis]
SDRMTTVDSAKSRSPRSISSTYSARRSRKAAVNSETGRTDRTEKAHSNNEKDGVLPVWATQRSSWKAREKVRFSCLYRALPIEVNNK